MSILLYTITKEEELIFAQPIHYTTKKEAEEAILNMYKEVEHKKGIANITYLGNELRFWDVAPGEPDEIHEFKIIEEVK